MVPARKAEPVMAATWAVWRVVEDMLKLYWRLIDEYVNM